MWILLALVAAAVVAVVFLDVGAGKTLVRATVVESRFQSERANDGRTLTTVVTDDGRRHTVSRPGRDVLAAGDVVQAEMVRGRARRLVRD